MSLLKAFTAELKLYWREALLLLFLIAAYMVILNWVIPPEGEALNTLLWAANVKTAHIPASPLITTLYTAFFHLFEPYIWLLQGLAFANAILMVLVFGGLTARIFGIQVALMASGLLLASWGFFSTCYLTDGTMPYVSLVLACLWCFYHWWDTAFRSRTYARSMMGLFSLTGVILSLLFLTLGFAGILFPLGVMGITIIGSQRVELLQDIRYQWLLIPFGITLLLGVITMGLLFGWLPYLIGLFQLRLTWPPLSTALGYLLPLLPLLIPFALSRPVWNRLLISYRRVLIFLGAWLALSAFFSFVLGAVSHIFVFLSVLPLWIGLAFYLAESFRNPSLAFSMQWVCDTLIIALLLVSVALILLTFQLVPDSMRPAFGILAVVLPLIALILMALRERTFSQSIPIILIPCAFVLCVLAKIIIEPVFCFTPQSTLLSPLKAKQIPMVIEWQVSNQPSLIALSVPHYKVVQTQTQLETLLAQSKKPCGVILPEQVYFSLPYAIRSQMSIAKTSWQWTQPLSIQLLLKAMSKETLDFEALTTPVILAYTHFPN